MTSPSTDNPQPSPPARSPGPAPVKLQSVAQLERELGTRQSRLLQLASERDHGQEQLRQLRQQHAELARQIRALDDQVAQTNQSIFVLISEVDWLLRVQQRIRDRAKALAQQTAQEETAPPPTRGSPREPLVIEINLESENNFFLGFSQNISEGGLFVATYNPRPLGERFPLAFRLPGQPAPIHAMMEVVWIHESAPDAPPDPTSGLPGMGLRFVGLPDTGRQAIADFLEHREPLFFPEFDDLS